MGKSVHTLGSPTEERRALILGRIACQAFESVPREAVSVRPLVDREVAFEHAAVSAERFDAGFDVGLPRHCELFGRGRGFRALEAEAIDAHAESTKLDVDIFAPRKIADRARPIFKYFVASAGIRADSDDAARMIQDDGRLRERLGKIGQVRNLRMEEPGIRGEI